MTGLIRLFLLRLIKSHIDRDKGFAMNPEANYCTGYAINKKNLTCHYIKEKSHTPFPSLSAAT
jgi:hypothetical protein